MRRILLWTTIVLIALAVGAGPAFADRCPYCGQQYGDAAPGDEGRIAALRAQHEASCPARFSGTSSSGGTTTDRSYDWEAAREAYIARAEARYDAAVAFYDEGDYDSAIKEASAALWMRWGNQKYTALLIKAQTRKRAQSEHEAGLAHERLGQWNAAIALFRAALTDHPESEAYAASLKRAEGGREAADRDRLTGRLSALADELSRPSLSPALTFKGGASGRTSIDRIYVPAPTITEKDYFQIKTPKQWPAVPTQAVRLSNLALRALQEAADYAVEKAEEKVKEMTIGRITENIPGYDTYESLKEKYDELDKGVSEYTLRLYETDMSAVRTGVVAVANPNDTGRTADEHGNVVENAGNRVRWDALKLAGKSAWWNISGDDDEDEDEEGETPGVIPIEKKKTDPHPDFFRIAPWLRIDR